MSEKYMDDVDDVEDADAVGDGESLVPSDVRGADAAELEILELQRQRLIERIQLVIAKGAPRLPDELDDWVGQLVALRIALGVDSVAKSAKNIVTLATGAALLQVGSAPLHGMLDRLAKRDFPPDSNIGGDEEGEG